MTKIFDLIPGWIWALLLAVAVAAGLGGAAVLTIKLEAARAEVAQAHAETAKQAADFANETRADIEAATLQLNQTLVTQGKAAEDARNQRDSARVAAAGERTEHQRLQQRIDELTAIAGGQSDGAAAAGGGKAAQEARDLLAYVRGRLEEARSGTIEFADSASIAGQLCERSYDALTNPATANDGRTQPAGVPAQPLESETP